MSARGFGKISACVVAIALWCAAIRLLSAALFSWWASTGPPNPDPAQYLKMGNRCFLGAVTAVAAGAVVSFIAMSKRRQYRLRTLLVLPVIVAVVGSLWSLATGPGVTILVFAGVPLVAWAFTRVRGNRVAGGANDG